MPDELQAVTELVKASSGLGSYVAKIFGSIPEDALGLLVGDWLNSKRRQNLAKIEAKTAAILKEIDTERFSEPSPSVLIPLLRSAVDESDDYLQSLWASLLANSMMDKGNRIRRAFIETLKSIESIDAKVLKAIDVINKKSIQVADTRYPGLGKNPIGSDRDFFAKIQMDILARSEIDFGISQDDLHASAFILERQGLITSSEYSERKNYLITTFGNSLIKACNINS